MAIRFINLKCTTDSVGFPTLKGRDVTYGALIAPVLTGGPFQPKESVNTLSIDYMVVAGGGNSNPSAPGNPQGFNTGGGGAGGVLIGSANQASVLTTASPGYACASFYCVPVTIGAAASVSCLATFVTCGGGQGAQSYIGNGTPGGSGGGGKPGNQYGTNSFGSGVAGQGQPGTEDNSGGGFSAANGTGYTTSISGTSATFAAGGVTGGNNPGATNTGNGAGGRSAPGGGGFSGGSGIVIVRAPVGICAVGGNACCDAAGNRSYIFNSAGAICFCGSSGRLWSKDI
jgi:hypothetical protein